MTALQANQLVDLRQTNRKILPWAVWMDWSPAIASPSHLRLVEEVLQRKRMFEKSCQFQVQWYRLHPSRAGSMTPIKPGPFQIGSREDRARRRCRTPAPLQGLSGIGIPSRKTQARHTGQLCSIRGKSGGGRPGGELSRRVGQTSGQSKSRRALRVAETLHLSFL
jgi:hypothetical protein